MRFRVCGVKEVGLYEQGMRPYVREGEEEGEGGGGWREIEGGVQCTRGEETNEISFTYVFKNSSRVVQFAATPPYTLTNLSHFLSTLPPVNVKIKTLCLSALKIPIKYLEITPPSSSSSSSPLSALKPSSINLAIARQHPGETSASHVL